MVNREAERKRLVELIENFFEEEIGASFVKGFLDKFADNILDDGWMRPPCEPKDKIYFVCEEYILHEYVEFIVIDENGVCIVDEKGTWYSHNGTNWYNKSLDKTVFTSREDAVKALEGDKGSGKS